jgi:hypothetical protein
MWPGSSETKLEMWYFYSLATFFFVSGIVIFPVKGFGQVVDCNADFSPERVLVRFKTGTTAAARQEAHTAAGGLEVLKGFNGVNGLYLIKVMAGQEQAAIAAYSNDSTVQYAEPDYIMRLDTIPNDTYFPRLYAMTNNAQTLPTGSGCIGCPDAGSRYADINAAEAWDIWQGDQSFRIAVIDTGVDYNHPDLKGQPPTSPGNIWINPCEDLNGNGMVDTSDFNGVDDACTGQQPNGYIDDIAGYNFLYPSASYPTPDPMDDQGHGTHIAGIIAGRGNNGTGVAGVNWRAKIVALKVASGEQDCSAVSDNIAAIQYCINNGIKVSNNSWGMPFYCQSLYDVIASARSNGHIFVASAGNNRRNVDPPNTPHYPSGYNLDNIISVAATDNDDNLSIGSGGQGSNWGATTVDLGAPGHNIWSTVPGSLVYQYSSGTSMAAPHVTGTIALLWSRVPNLTYTQVRNQVLNTTRKIASLKGKCATEGVVDAYRAVLWDCDGICTNPLCVGVGQDCNGNGVFDGCDIAAGESCDEDGNRIPDECGACCTQDEFGQWSCETGPIYICPSPSKFYAGVTCDECSCFQTACCAGSTCCELPGCECVTRGGSSTSADVCQAATCTTGACCTAQGCDDILLGELATKPACDYVGGEFFGGWRCKGGLCTTPPKSCSSDFDCGLDGPCIGSPLQRSQASPCRPTCPSGTIDKVASTNPPDMVVDARYPHLSGNPLAKRGIGDPDSLQERDHIKIKLTDGGSPVSGADWVECWCLCDTGWQDPGLVRNSISCITDMGNGLYEIHLVRPITAGESTTVSYRKSTPYMTYTSHPANVNGNTASTPADILDLIDYLNGVRTLPWGFYSCDIDHNNFCVPADILAEIDLLNGASGFQVWNGTPMPLVSPCPEDAGCASSPTACVGAGAGGGGAGGGGGGNCTADPCGGGIEPMAMAVAGGVMGTVAGVPASESENDYFADWFVKYVTTAVPASAAAEADFRLMVDALAKWCLDHFSAGERAALADRLSAAAGVAAAPTGSESAAAAALRIAP